MNKTKKESKALLFCFTGNKPKLCNKNINLELYEVSEIKTFVRLRAHKNYVLNREMTKHYNIIYTPLFPLASTKLSALLQEGMIVSLTYLISIDHQMISPSIKRGMGGVSIIPSIFQNFIISSDLNAIGS